MGQYHLTVNLDKREYIDPHKLGVGLKLREQSYGVPGGGIGNALIVLLAASSGRGGGDFDMEQGAGVVGRWAGDKIAIVGDYGERGDLDDQYQADKIYQRCRNGRYRDVTDLVVKVLSHSNGVMFVGEGWRAVVEEGARIHVPGGGFTPGLGYHAACGVTPGDEDRVCYQARYKEITCPSCRTIFLRGRRRAKAEERRQNALKSDAPDSEK